MNTRHVPCTCGRVTGQPYTVDQCFTCYQIRYSAKTQKALGLPVTAPIRGLVEIPRHLFGFPSENNSNLGCMHLGGSVGQRIKLNCVSDPPTKVPAFSCKVHGECTVTDVSRNIKCCRFCSDFVPRNAKDAVCLKGGGIGDALLLAAVSRKPIIVHPNLEPWARLFTSTLEWGTPAVKTIDLAAYDHRHELPRWEFWARILEKTPPERQVSVKLPKAPVITGKIEWAGRVVLAPYAKHAQRTWPLNRWIRLEELILEKGHSPLVLAEKGQDVSAFKGEKLVNGSPEEVCGVIQDCVAFVGNDSGMAHVAGWLRVPAVALSAKKASDTRIFDLYPTVRELGGHFAGFDDITPEQVYEAVRAQIRAHCPFPVERLVRAVAPGDQYRMDHWVGIYGPLYRLAKELSPRVVCEIGTRAGYSAWTWLEAGAQHVHGFDLDCNLHGGYQGAHEHARSILPQDRFDLSIGDSHLLYHLPPCDVAYIDGDHTEAGAYQDLLLAERSNAPVIVLDDVTNLTEVRRAGDRFCDERGIVPEFVASRTGWYIIRMRPGRNTPGMTPDQIQEIFHMPSSQNGKLRWSYGVTTVKQRRSGTLPKTLDSLARAGFDRPRLFVDGDTDNNRWAPFGQEFTLRYPNIGAFGNWVMALWELYLRDPKADRYAIFQDDVLACKNLREYLDRCPYPRTGYMNLYLWPQNAALAPRDEGGNPRECTWYESNQMGLGAVGLVFDRRAVHRLLESPNIVERPTEVINPNSKVDGAVVWAMHLINWKEWVHYPSLLQHTGEVSTMGNSRHPPSPAWMGEDYDPLAVLKSRPVQDVVVTADD